MWPSSLPASYILSVIHYTIRGAVCFQFTHFPCDDWENIHTLSQFIIKSEVWNITHCLGLGHETLVCAVCHSVFLSTIEFAKFLLVSRVVTYMTYYWHSKSTDVFEMIFFATEFTIFVKVFVVIAIVMTSGVRVLPWCPCVLMPGFSTRETRMTVAAGRMMISRLAIRMPALHPLCLLMRMLESGLCNGVGDRGWHCLTARSLRPTYTTACHWLEIEVPDQTICALLQQMQAID